MNAGSPDNSVTAHDVRTAQFTLVKRGGYDTQEVDAFLDQVAEGLDRVADLEYRAPARPPAVAEPEPVRPSQPLGEAKLHDPDGAAQRLLAAAQRTSDTLTAEADAYAAKVRVEADAYASSTRAEADEHAMNVTSTADAQAGAIRSAAAEEARRIAEETRSTLVKDIDDLEARRNELAVDADRVQQLFDADRARLLDVVEGLRREIVVAGGGSPDPDDQPSRGSTQSEPVAAIPESRDSDRDSDTGDEDEVVLADGGSPVDEDAASSAGVSVFDIEADADWDGDEGPPTELISLVDPASSGDDFFDSLDAAEGTDDGLGPLDSDTDAAMNAFFDADEVTDGGRRRFGGRS